MEIKCTQCGAGIEISEDSGFINCPYCDSRLYVDTSQTVRHFYLKPGLKPEQIPGIISRELLKLELKQAVAVTSADIIFIPFWLIRLKDKMLRFPAGSLEFSELRNFNIPVGALVPYESEIESRYHVEMPALSLDDILKRTALEKARDEVERTDLIHVPFYKVGYKYQGKQYRAMIDAGEGGLYADKRPAGLSGEKDKYFMALFIILSVLFLVESFAIPWFWIMVLAYLATGGIAWYVVSRLLLQKGY